MATVPSAGNDDIAGTGAGESIAAQAGNDLVRAGGGDDTVHGDAGNDKLFGEAGNDRLWGDAGNDEIDGGAGTDTAVFSGNQAQYEITTAGGVTEVKDLRGRGSNTPDGIDKLVDVERLAFADGVRLLAADLVPDAMADAAQTNEDTAITINVLGNDTDPDGDALSIASLSDADPAKPGNQTALGATISVVGGQLRYDPSASDALRALNTGQSAADSFTYTVSDDFGGRDTAAVGVTVNGLSLNEPPDARDDFAATSERAAPLIAVLGNDTDPDGGALSIASLSDADPTKPGNQTTLGATVSIEGGQVRYDPAGSAALQALNSGQSANDSFTYTVSDGSGGADTAGVRVTVLGGNLPPDAVGDTAAVGGRAATLIPVLGNDTDPDGDALAIIVLSDADPARDGFQTALGATVSVDGGQVRYDPLGSAALRALDSREVAADSFTYTVSDGSGGADTAEVRVLASGGNLAPDAIDDTAVTLARSPIHIPVLGNDRDLDGDGMSIVNISDTDPVRDGFQTLQGATVSVDGGSVIYDPTGSGPLQALPAGARTEDSFIYTVSDRYGGQDLAVVTVSVTGEQIFIH